MPDLNYFSNRESLIEKTFMVKVAYPKQMKQEYINPITIYNVITAGKNFVECEAKEVSVQTMGMSHARIVRDI